MTKMNRTRLIGSIACVMWCLLCGVGLGLLSYSNPSNPPAISVMIAIVGAIIGAAVLAFVITTGVLKRWWAWLHSDGSSCDR